MDIKCPHCGSYINIREVVSRCTECGKNLFNLKKENMKATLENFLVKWDGNNPLWKELIEWLNKNKTTPFAGYWQNKYYGIVNGKKDAVLFKDIAEHSIIITLEQWKELLTKKENMKNVFKKDDSVYVWPYGWCEFYEYRYGYVQVTQDGMTYDVNLKLVSFTQYRLEGFTQERPFEPIVGNYYWFWDDEMIDKKASIFGKLGEIDKSDKRPYYCIGAACYANISDKTPLECQ
jgi:predicted  nucleic acid-binding Zn-ribbon protein